MADNEFLPFAVAGGANVEDQAAYAADALRTGGNQPGVAVSALTNKALRQGTVVAAALAQVVCDTLNEDVLDDGDVEALTDQIAELFAVASAFVKVSGNVNQAIPDAGAVAIGTRIDYVKTDAATTVTFTLTGGQTLSGAGTGVYTLTEQYSFMSCRTDGTNWFIVAAG